VLLFTLGARGCSCAVSDVGDVSIVTRAKNIGSRSEAKYFRPLGARKKPLVSRAAFFLTAKP